MVLRSLALFLGQKKINYNCYHLKHNLKKRALQQDKKVFALRTILLSLYY